MHYALDIQNIICILTSAITNHHDIPSTLLKKIVQNRQLDNNVFSQVKLDITQILFHAVDTN
jgi:hypothetical protein